MIRAGDSVLWRRGGEPGRILIGTVQEVNAARAVLTVTTYESRKDMRQVGKTWRVPLDKLQKIEQPAEAEY